jgi:hypothetical protein
MRAKNLNIVVLHTSALCSEWGEHKCVSEKNGAEHQLQYELLPEKYQTSDLLRTYDIHKSKFEPILRLGSLFSLNLVVNGPSTVLSLTVILRVSKHPSARGPSRAMVLAENPGCYR